MDVVQNPTLGAVANFLRRENLTMEISYGSGGFCVVLKMLKGNKMQISGYAWDIQQAFDKALENLKDLQESTGSKEEDTVPGKKKQ